MPIYMDISRMNRLVVIVAKGDVTADEIAANTRTLVEADVPGYAKIIDTAGSNSDLTREQVDKIATLLRGDPKDRTRGPVAFVVNPDPKGACRCLCGGDLGRAANPTFQEPPHRTQVAA